MITESKRNECHRCGPSYEPTTIEYIDCEGNTIQRHFNPGDMDSFCIDEIIFNPNRFCKPMGVPFSDKNDCPKEDMKKLKCQCVEVIINEIDLNNSTNNTEGVINSHLVSNMNGKVFLTVFECGTDFNPSSLRVFDSPGTYNICIFSVEDLNGHSLFYFKDNLSVIAGNSTYSVSDNECLTDNDCLN